MACARDEFGLALHAYIYIYMYIYAAGLVGKGIYRYICIYTRPYMHKLGLKTIYMAPFIYMFGMLTVLVYILNMLAALCDKCMQMYANSMLHVIHQCTPQWEELPSTLFSKFNVNSYHKGWSGLVTMVRLIICKMVIAWLCIWYTCENACKKLVLGCQNTYFSVWTY